VGTAAVTLEELINAVSSGPTDHAG